MYSEEQQTCSCGCNQQKCICLCIVGHRLKTERGGTGGLFACKVGHSRCVGIIRDKHHKKDW